MIKKILILIILLLSISAVAAGNNTTTIDHPTVHIEEAETVTALESGDSNISFSDGYKGYCIEWGQHSAEAGDKFYIHNEVDNNIKVFFVYFYEESQRDTIATQHMIWKFTDNKQFSKFNQTLYEQIINVSSKIQVPNEGTLKLNSTTEMVFNFKNFISPIEECQNYFGYKIFFRNITYQINNSTTNNIIVVLPQLQNNTINFTVNELIINESNIPTSSSTSNYEKIVISSHETGININWLIACLIILIIICLLLY